MRTIAIILGDNDFGSTFEPLLQSIKEIYKYKEWWDNWSLTPEQVRKIILEGIRYHYIAFQLTKHKNRIDNESPESVNKTVRYLSYSIRILFDEEAEQDILKEDQDSGAWYLDLQTGRISSY